MPEPLQSWVIARIAATQAAHGLLPDTALVDLKILRVIEKKAAGATPRDCAHCGAPYKARSSHQKYCSRACLDAAWKGKNTPLAIRECRHCGERYQPKAANQIYCCRTCNKTANDWSVRKQRAAARAMSQAIALRSFSPVKRIQQICAATWRVPIWEMWSPNRQRAVSWPRFAAMKLARDLLGLSWSQIGHVFGHRDHTSILHGCRTCERLIEESETYAQRYRAAEAKCKLALEKAQ